MTLKTELMRFWYIRGQFSHGLFEFLPRFEIFFAGVKTADGKFNLPSAVRTPAKKIDKKLHVFTSKLRGIQRTSLWLDWDVKTSLSAIKNKPKKMTIRPLQMNVLALVFKTHHETLKLYTVLSLNNKWISSHIDWTLTLHCQTGQ